MKTQKDMNKGCDVLEVTYTKDPKQIKPLPTCTHVYTVYMYMYVHVHVPIPL